MNTLLEKYLINEKRENPALIDYEKALKELEVAFKKLTINKDKMLKKHKSLIKIGKLYYGDVGDLGRLKSDIEDILEYLKY